MILHFLLSNAVPLLLVPLAFFLLIAVIRAIASVNLSSSKVWLTIKAALLGVATTILARSVNVPPAFTPYVREIQGLILLLCLGNLLAYLLVDLYLEFRMKRQVPTFLRELVHAAVYLFAAATALRVIFEIDMASILTTTTVLTAAVAFAMQTTLASIVSGFHIQADGNFKRRTWVWIKDKEISGEIVNVGFRYSTLRTTERHLVHIPNNFLAQNIVHAIGNRDDGPAGINLKVLLDYSLSPEKAKTILLECLREEPGILAEPAPAVRIDLFMENGIQYNLRYHLEDYGTLLAARDAILGRVWYAVAREGQTFPYPHREIIGKKPEPPFRPGDRAVRDHLRRIEVLSPLEDEVLDELSNRVHPRIFGPGEAVVRQGEEGNSLFVNLCGDLDVSVDGRNVGRVTRGEFFGEMSLLTGEKRRATVTAVGEVRLIEISKEAIEPIVQSHPAVAEGLSVALERRMEKIVEARQLPMTAAEAATPPDVILRKIKNFFGVS